MPYAFTEQRIKITTIMQIEYTQAYHSTMAMLKKRE